MHEGVWFPKNIFDKMVGMRTWIFQACINDLCYDSAYTGRSTPTTAFDGAI